MRKNCFGLLFFILVLHSRPRNSIDNSSEKNKPNTITVEYVNSKQSNFNISIANARDEMKGTGHKMMQNISFLFRSFDIQCLFAFYFLLLLSFSLSVAVVCVSIAFNLLHFPLFYFIYELFLLFGSSLLLSFRCNFFYFFHSFSLALWFWFRCFFCIYHLHADTRLLNSKCLLPFRIAPECVYYLNVTIWNNTYIYIWAE